MNQMPPNFDEAAEEKPLDPALERVRAKMLRLLVVSIGTMFIAIFAVLFAIVYKLNAGSAPANVTYEMSVPAGFETETVTAGNGEISVVGRSADGARLVLVFEAGTGTLKSSGRFTATKVPQ